MTDRQSKCVHGHFSTIVHVNIAGTILYAAQLLQSFYLKFTHEKHKKCINFMKQYVLPYSTLLLASAAFIIH